MEGSIGAADLAAAEALAWRAYLAFMTNSVV